MSRKKVEDYSDAELLEWVRTSSRQSFSLKLTRALVGSEFYTKLLACKQQVRPDKRETPTSREAKVAKELRKSKERAAKQSTEYIESVPILGFSRYRVSKSGRVWSDSIGDWMTPGIGTSGQGYYYVNLYCEGDVKTYYVHRIVAAAFIPNPEGKRSVNHKDGNAKNNALSNLEWATPKENTAHAIELGLFKPGEYGHLRAGSDALDKSS